MILKVLSAEPKKDQYGNIQYTSTNSIKYRATLQNPQAPGTPLSVTAYGDWITEDIGREADLEVKQMPGIAGGPSYTVVNRIKPAESVADKQIEANPPGPVNRIYEDPHRQELIVRQNSLTNANATLSRLSAVTDKLEPLSDKFVREEADRTIQLAEMYFSWVMKGTKEPWKQASNFGNPGNAHPGKRYPEEAA